MIERIHRIMERIPKSRFLHFSVFTVLATAILLVIAPLSFNVGIVAAFLACPATELLMASADKEGGHTDIIDFVSGLAGGGFVCLSAALLNAIVS